MTALLSSNMQVDYCSCITYLQILLTDILCILCKLLAKKITFSNSNVSFRTCGGDLSHDSKYFCVLAPFLLLVPARCRGCVMLLQSSMMLSLLLPATCLQ